MPMDEEGMRRMDEAASRAQEELERNLEAWSARELAAWWATWYLKAGHKRLGRILVAMQKRSA
jgi:hypothetical protein